MLLICLSVCACVCVSYPLKAFSDRLVNFCFVFFAPCRLGAQCALDSIFDLAQYIYIYMSFACLYCMLPHSYGFTFLVLAYPGCPGKEAVKWLLLLLLLFPTYSFFFTFSLLISSLTYLFL